MAVTMSEGAHLFCQVIGPHAARKWLEDIESAMQLRYRFVHCCEFDQSHNPERTPLLHALGGATAIKQLPVAAQSARAAMIYFL